MEGNIQERKDSLLTELLSSIYEECSNVNFKEPMRMEFVHRFHELIDTVKRSRSNIDDYEKIKVIGKGAFGVVYLAKSKVNSQVVALKVLSKWEMIKKGETACFRAEKESLYKASISQLSGVTKLICSFQDENFLYLVLEYCPGGDLLGLQSQYDDPNEITEDMAAFYIAELVSAIHELHSIGYAHRDIKPDNIFIDQQGHIKIGDFVIEHCFSLVTFKGSSVELTKDGKIASKISVGTPDYIAPEILSSIEKKTEYDASCDYWSCGIVMYELLYGEPPFYSDSLMKTYHKIQTCDLKFPDDEIQRSEDAKDLIRKWLCLSEVRLKNIDEIKAHPFFKNINWNDFYSIKPPYVPNIKDIFDTCHFDEIDDLDEVGLSSSKPKGMSWIDMQLPFLGYSIDSKDIKHLSPQTSTVELRPLHSSRRRSEVGSVLLLTEIHEEKVSRDFGEAEYRPSSRASKRSDITSVIMTSENDLHMDFHGGRRSENNSIPPSPLISNTPFHEDKSTSISNISKADESIQTDAFEDNLLALQEEVASLKNKMKLLSQKANSTSDVAETKRKTVIRRSSVDRSSMNRVKTLEMELYMKSKENDNLKEKVAALDQQLEERRKFEEQLLRKQNNMKISDDAKGRSSPKVEKGMKPSDSESQKTLVNVMIEESRASENLVHLKKSIKLKRNEDINLEESLMRVMDNHEAKKKHSNEDEQSAVKITEAENTGGEIHRWLNGKLMEPSICSECDELLYSSSNHILICKACNFVTHPECKIKECPKTGYPASSIQVSNRNTILKEHALSGTLKVCKIGITKSNIFTAWCVLLQNYLYIFLLEEDNKEQKFKSPPEYIINTKQIEKADRLSDLTFLDKRISDDKDLTLVVSFLQADQRHYLLLTVKEKDELEKWVERINKITNSVFDSKKHDLKSIKNNVKGEIIALEITENYIITSLTDQINVLDRKSMELVKAITGMKKVYQIVEYADAGIFIILAGKPQKYIYLVTRSLKLCKLEDSKEAISFCVTSESTLFVVTLKKKVLLFDMKKYPKVVKMKQEIDLSMEQSIPLDLVCNNSSLCLLFKSFFRVIDYKTDIKKFTGLPMKMPNVNSTYTCAIFQIEQGGSIYCFSNYVIKINALGKAEKSVECIGNPLYYRMIKQKIHVWSLNYFEVYDAKDLELLEILPVFGMSLLSHSGSLVMFDSCIALLNE